LLKQIPATEYEISISSMHLGTGGETARYIILIIIVIIILPRQSIARYKFSADCKPVLPPYLPTSPPFTAHTYFLLDHHNTHSSQNNPFPQTCPGPSHVRDSRHGMMELNAGIVLDTTTPEERRTK